MDNGRVFDRLATEVMLVDNGFAQLGATFERMETDRYGVKRIFTVITYEDHCQFFAPNTKRSGKTYVANVANITNYLTQSFSHYGLTF